MKRYLYFLFLCFSLCITYSSHAENIKSKIIFKCQLSNKSIIQIHHHIINNTDYYIYSHIKNGHKKIELKQNGTNMLKNSMQHHYLRGNGSNMFFPNGIYGYNVFSSFEIPENPNKPIISRNGVHISKGKDNFFKTIMCKKTHIPLST